jgi:hypothetical protein
MSCSCSNTPNPPPNPTRPTEPSFLDIVRSNSVTPPNATHKVKASARVGDKVHNGTGLLTYTAKDGVVSHLFQFIPDDPNGPQFHPLSGIGFKNIYEYRSKNNGDHHFEHSFITNTIHIHPDSQVAGKESDYHISAEPASLCLCTEASCKDFGGNCVNCICLF